MPCLISACVISASIEAEMIQAEMRQGEIIIRQYFLADMVPITFKAITVLTGAKYLSPKKMARINMIQEKVVYVSRKRR